MMYNSGPSIEPCGTSTDIFLKLELKPSLLVQLVEQKTFLPTFR